VKVLITGGTGLLGSAFRPFLPEAIYLSKAFDLRNYSIAYDAIQTYQPDVIIHLAAKVGGVLANMSQMGDFYTDNIHINTNVLEAAKVLGVKKVVSCLSTCIYPDKTTYPLIEDHIHDGPPHPSNFAYAYTKRMLDVQSRAYRLQYGCNFVTVVPNNLFGEQDNFHTENGHVIPSLIRKIYEAKKNDTSVTFWGDGDVYREFTYSGDAAKAILFVVDNYNGETPINIGNTTEYLLKDVVEYLLRRFQFKNEVVWDITKPKGQYRKPSSNAKLLSLGWNDYCPFYESLGKMCDWFESHYPNVRGM
jgi:GDP-L-fucose synthase